MLKHEEELNNLFQIFQNSEAELRPHFILSGESGSGKSYTIKQLADKYKLGFLDINAAQLTKEGTSGNSLSKALAPLSGMRRRPTVIFVDEFDKLFISGNQNSDLAHETTNGVQNEFLKILESDTTSVFGDYGKYVSIPVSHCLFVFAGAFNGEEDLDLDRLRELGLKTEFLGRVGLTFSTERVSLETLIETMKDSVILATYLKLVKGIDKDTVVDAISEQLTESYDNNTLGYRLITTLIHQYFITKDRPKKDKTVPAFTKKIQF